MVATVEKKGTTTTTYYHHTDHLSGASVTTGTGGEVAEITDYYPYGNIRFSDTSSGFSEQRKFTGHELDTDTNLTYMGARYYEGTTGRFRSIDPAYLAVGTPQLKEKTNLELVQYLSDPQVLNSYSYVRNNPINATDPDGNFLQFIIASLLWPNVAYSPNVGEEGGSRGFETALFVGSLLTPGGEGSAAAKGVVKVAGNEVENLAKGFVNNKNFSQMGRFGAQLGSKMNQVAKNLEGQAYEFTDHAIQRIAQKIGVGNENQVLNTLKNKPFDYFHDGVEKLGYIDNKTKTFVGQVKDSKIITTVINNISNNYKKNLLQKPR